VIGRWLSWGLAVLLAGPAVADNMLMGRVPLAADVVMAYVESSIEEHGYRVAHRQTCDTGLGDVGYKSDYYQVVFFGKPGEVRWISATHPELVSHLPLKLAVIAERDETLLTALNPEALIPFFPDEAVQIQLARWHSDLVSILDDVRRATAARSADP
jgi:uncharacterized protein (DUF302 family)